MFEVLSDLPQDGDLVSGAACTVYEEGYTLVRKRRHLSTGGKSNEKLENKTSDIHPENEFVEFVCESEFAAMNTDEKLSAIF